MPNIDPAMWGKSFWNTIYYVIISYSDQPTNDQKTHVKNFLESLQFVLPCETCRLHYQDNLKNFPLTNEVLSSRSNLLLWAINVNNEVNVRLGKPKVTIETILERYIQNKNEWRLTVTILLLIFLVIVLIYYVRQC